MPRKQSVIGQSQTTSSSAATSPVSADSGWNVLLAGNDASNEKAHATIAKLGPVPMRANSLIAMLQVDAKDPIAVAKAAAMCPAMAARLISTVNSVSTGVTTQVNSVERATVLLGAGRARALALTTGLKLLAEKSGLPKAVADTLWANSVQKACAAKQFCQIIDHELADIAYCAALVQDIGLPMLMAADLNFYLHELKPGPDVNWWTRSERERFGIDHGMVGEHLLKQWNASQRLQQITLNHHLPPAGNDQGRDALLQLALFLASLIPHLHEEPGPRQVNWIQAIHARFLYVRHPTPDEFLRGISMEAKRMRGGLDLGQNISTEQLLNRLLNEVNRDMNNLVSSMCQMEETITRERRDLHDLRMQAFTDPLTRALNRRGFMHLSSQNLELAAKKNLPVCCMVCDMDDFKRVNDTHGHHAGDRVLRAIVKLLRRGVGRESVIGRLGGDEFAVIMTGISETQARAVAQRIVEFVQNRTLRIDRESNVDLKFSLGCIYSEQLADVTVDRLLSMADKAMYKRKRDGKQGVEFTVLGQPAPDLQQINNAISKTRQDSRP